MVEKTFCDFCKEEIKTFKCSPEIIFMGEKKHICDTCTEKVVEFLQSIQK